MAYLVYCKVGVRSKLAQKTMKKLGFRKVYNLVGGTLLWDEEGLPFEWGGQSTGLSMCPVILTIAGFRKVKKFLQIGRRPFPKATMET